MPGSPVFAAIRHLSAQAHEEWNGIRNSIWSRSIRLPTGRRSRYGVTSTITTCLTTNCTIRTIPASAARTAHAPFVPEKIRELAVGLALPKLSADSMSSSRPLSSQKHRSWMAPSAAFNPLTRLAKGARDSSPIADWLRLGEEDPVQALY